MSLKLIVDNEGSDANQSAKHSTNQSRAVTPEIIDVAAKAPMLALGPGGDFAQDKAREIPPLPPTPSKAIPIALAQLLRHQEPVVWWSSKQGIEWQPAAWASFAGILLLTFASLFAPTLWSQPILDLVSVIAATQAVAIVVVVREWTSRRHVVVTDTSIADIDWRGNGDRIAFRNVRTVKRDWWSGGIRLGGEAHEVRIPPTLMDDTRAAIAHQMAYTMNFGSVTIDDPLSWFPQTSR